MPFCPSRHEQHRKQVRDHREEPQSLQDNGGGGEGKGENTIGLDGERLRHSNQETRERLHQETARTSTSGLDGGGSRFIIYSYLSTLLDCRPGMSCSFFWWASLI